MGHDLGDHPLNAYEELVAIWSSQEYEPLQVDYWFYMKFNRALSLFLEQAPSASWILDLRTQQFDFVSRNIADITGYEAEEFKKEGLFFCNAIKHPDDLENTWKLLRQVWAFIMKAPAAERSHYKYTHDYRICRPDSTVVRILEQTAVLQQDRKDNITHILGSCTEITNWKKGEEQIAVVTSTLHNETYRFTTEGMVPDSSPAILSKRELEIVRLLAQGFSSKYIADKLCISFHTVNTHRHNMMEKTKTKNTSELVNFVYSHGML